MIDFQEQLGQRGHGARDAWMAKFAEYSKQFPNWRANWRKSRGANCRRVGTRQFRSSPPIPKDWPVAMHPPKWKTRLRKHLPWLIGGAADLAPSTKTRLTFDGAGDLEADNYGGRNLHFGIREHAMGSILNGLSLSKLRPFGSGFLIFSDYMRAPIRLSALMEIPVIYIFTHDSIGVGEDGPTHQPVEQLISLRAIPGLIVIRPGDANEVAEAWRVIVQLTHEPVCLILSRQNMPTFDRAKYGPVSGVAYGAYVLADPPEGKPDVILIGTGSEVSLCVDAYETLTKEGIKARVVSMPSWELFEQQSYEYQNAILPPRVKARVSVEQASVFGWDRYARRRIGMHTFGASAPLKELQKKFGFTPDAVAAAAKEELAKAQ